MFRKVAVVTLLMLYVLDHGLFIVGGIIFWIQGNSQNNAGMSEVGSSVVIGGGLVMSGTLFAFWKKAQLGVVVAFLHTLAVIVLSIFMLYGLQAEFDDYRREQLEKGRRVTAQANIVQPGHLFTIGAHVLVLIAAVTAFMSADWRQVGKSEVMRSDSAEVALIKILAMAISTDGAATPKKVKMAVQVWSAFVGTGSSAFQISTRLLRIAETAQREDLVAKSCATLARVITAEQRTWLMEVITAICGADGPPEPLAQDFLSDLNARL